MSYGIRTWGADGALQLDENSFTMRVVLSTLVFETGGFTDFPVPGCTPQNCSAVVVPLGPLSNPATQDPYAIQFEPEVLNGVVRVWKGHRTAVQGIFARGTQRLIVMRFK